MIRTFALFALLCAAAPAQAADICAAVTGGAALVPLSQAKFAADVKPFVTKADPTFQEAVRRGGGVPSQVLGESFRKLALNDSQTWGDLIKRLGITLSS